MPFKSYADLESLLKGVKSSDKNNASYTEIYQDHTPCGFAVHEVVCIDNKFSKKVILYRGKMQLIDSLKQFLKNVIIVKNKKSMLIRTLLCLTKMKTYFN